MADAILWRHEYHHVERLVIVFHLCTVKGKSESLRPRLLKDMLVVDEFSFRWIST